MNLDEFVLVIYGCVTNDPQTQRFKATATVYYLFWFCESGNWECSQVYCDLGSLLQWLELGHQGWSTWGWLGAKLFMESQGLSRWSHFVVLLAGWPQGSKGRCPKRGWQKLLSLNSCRSLPLCSVSLKPSQRPVPRFKGRGHRLPLNWEAANICRCILKPPQNVTSFLTWRKVSESSPRGDREIKREAWWEC